MSTPAASTGAADTNPLMDEASASPAQSGADESPASSGDAAANSGNAAAGATSAPAAGAAAPNGGAAAGASAEESASGFGPDGDGADESDFDPSSHANLLAALASNQLMMDGGLGGLAGHGAMSHAAHAHAHAHAAGLAHHAAAAHMNLNLNAAHGGHPHHPALGGGMGAMGAPMMHAAAHVHAHAHAAAAAGGLLHPGNGGMNGGGGLELCRAYLAGRCSRGAACRFMHVDNTSGHQAPNPHLCRDWLNGTCIRGNTCRFQHQGVSGSKASIPGSKGGWSAKPVLCHQWSSRGRCDYGTSCKFSHARPTAEQQAAAAAQGQRWPGNNHPNAAANGGADGADDKKLLANVLSGMTSQEVLSQALSLQNARAGGNANAGGNAAAGAASQPASSSSPTAPQTNSGAQAQSGASSSGSADSGSNAGANEAGNASGASGPHAGGNAGNGGMAHPGGMGMPGVQVVPPTKRADGSLILCRFYARHGWCKYGVGCKFHHAPLMGLGPGMMANVNPNLANLLALGLKASMISNDHLIANHAALLAASMQGQGGRHGHAAAMGQAPVDPHLASVLAAYLQTQAPMGANGGMMQGAHGGAGTGGSISPSHAHALGAAPYEFQGADPAFQAFMQQQAQAGFNPAAYAGFNPAAASAFNALPNLTAGPTAAPVAAAGGAGGAGGAAGASASPSPVVPGANGMSLPQMINTAFRSTSGGHGAANAAANNLATNLSLMSLKAYDDQSPAFDAEAHGHGHGHARAGSGSFAAGESSGAGAAPGFESGAQGAQGGNPIGGAPGASTLSAIFSTSLSAEPFLH